MRFGHRVEGWILCIYNKHALAQVWYQLGSVRPRRQVGAETADVGIGEATRERERVRLTYSYSARIMVIMIPLKPK